jgi:N-acyl-D-aspartate/D-glutamate deacylase
MGERSFTDEAPTPDELARLRDLAAESVAGGAVGFSTSRILLHVVPDGRKVPGTFAGLPEYLAVADGMNDAGGGLFQAVLDFETRAGEEFGLLRAMAERAGDVLFTAGPGNDPRAGVAVAEGWDRFLADTRAEAGRITALTMTRPSGTLMGLLQVPPVKGPEWRTLMHLPTLDDRLAALRDPATRSRLVAEGVERGLWYDPRHIHPLGDGEVPEFHIEGGPSVAELAEAAGRHPAEWIVDRLDASDGRELFNVWFFHRNRAGLEALLALDTVYPGAGDAGAHAGQICDADAPTHFLAHWVRERNLVTLPEAVRRLTSQAAAVLGLVDRGTVEVGRYADLNVFDPDRLQPGYPEYRTDVPGGSGRLCVGATGYAATLVNGEVVTEQGTNTGARPGRVLREFRRG